MKKHTTYTTLLLIFLWTLLFITCKRPEEELHVSAQYFHPADSYLYPTYHQKSWYLVNNEFGVLPLVTKWHKVSRIAINYNTNSIYQDFIDTLPSIWKHNQWLKINNQRLIQLDKNRFLLSQSLESATSQYNNQLYLTDEQRKNKILITGRDSSRAIVNNTILPDNKILFHEYMSIGNTHFLTCINTEGKQEWTTPIAYSPAPNSNTRTTGIAASNNTILVLQNEIRGVDLSNVVRRYDFSGNLIQSNFMAGYENTHYFSHVLPHQDGFMLIGIKYNKVSHHFELCFLSMDASLNPIKEKAIPFDDIFSDWDFSLNTPKLIDAYEMILKPTIHNGFILLPIPYYSKNSGSSLKLIKLNQSFEVEFVKPIFNNIPKDIENVGVKANDDYIYVGGLNYKGFFFYRMDQNGDFK